MNNKSKMLWIRPQLLIDLSTRGSLVKWSTPVGSVLDACEGPASAWRKDERADRFLFQCIRIHYTEHTPTGTTRSVQYSMNRPSRR